MSDLEEFIGILRTRQAPSPTGYLHLGTARQILYTMLLANSMQGSWYLRVDDTDRKRLRKLAVKNLLYSLELIGIKPPEGVTLEKTNVYNNFYDVYQKGNFGPYIQSERLDIYHLYAQKMLDKGLAYWNFLSPEQKEELQEIKKINKKQINYYETNLKLFGKEKIIQPLNDILLAQNNSQENDLRPALMYKLQKKQKIDCYDLLLGKTTFDLELEEDFVIIKSDGYPTYHFAHLIDDFLTDVNLVIRAQEWYSSFPKHIDMFQNFWSDEKIKYTTQNGKNTPSYIHLPFILNTTGNKKMSKRDGDVNMLDFLKKGYLAESLLNYLVFLGWRPKNDEKELYLTVHDFI